MKRFVPLIPLLLLIACGDTGPVRGEPPTASIRQSTLDMDSVTTAIFEVTSSGDWMISTGADWLTAEPSAGSGNATVVLTAHPETLVAGHYSTTVTVAADAGGDSVDVAFSFPRVAGTMRVAQASGARVEGLGMEELPASAGRLLVGLERPEPGRASQPGRQRFEEKARAIGASEAGLSLLDAYPASGVAVYSARSRRDAASRLAMRPGVRYVELDAQLERLAVDDTYRSRQWSLDTIAAEAAWTGATGAGVRVAVIDSGFRTDHPDLASNVSYSHDFGDARPEVESSNENCGTHGQHVAGIVAAVTGNGTGIAGVAPNAQLLLLDVDSSDEWGCPMYVSSLVAALDWLAGDAGVANADVVNMSLGLASPVRALEDALISLDRRGVTVVAAAGNDPSAPVMYPAAYRSVIAVSATGPVDEIADYSTTGSQIWVSAPGGNAASSATIEDALYSTIFDYAPTVNGYGYMQGTSMASPVVAGVAALLLSAGAGLGPCDVARLLADSSVDLGPPGWDATFGHGRVDAARAVAAASTATAEPCRLFLQVNGAPPIEVPLDGGFDIGYVVPGQLALAAGSDGDGDGVLGEMGDYYGEVVISVAFEGPVAALDLILETVE